MTSKRQVYHNSEQRYVHAIDPYLVASLDTGRRYANNDPHEIVHEPAKPKDGTRILVDSIWSRDVCRRILRVDSWYNGAAPSSVLGRWFNHYSARWNGFRGVTSLS